MQLKDKSEGRKDKSFLPFFKAKRAKKRKRPGLFTAEKREAEVTRRISGLTLFSLVL